MLSPHATAAFLCIIMLRDCKAMGKSCTKATAKCRSFSQLVETTVPGQDLLRTTFYPSACYPQ